MDSLASCPFSSVTLIRVTRRCLVFPLWHHCSSVFSGLLHPSPYRFEVRKPLLAWKMGPDRRCGWARVAVCLLITVLAICERRGTVGCARSAVRVCPDHTRFADRNREAEPVGWGRGPPSVCSHRLPSEVRPRAC